MFNHIQLPTISAMARERLLSLPHIRTNKLPKLSCTGCAHGKRRPQPHHRTHHTYDIGIALSSDVCGTITASSLQGNQYVIIFVDTASRYAFAYFAPNRTRVLPAVDTVLRIVTNTHGRPPRLFTTDNAREYISKAAMKIYNQLGITPNPTIPYNPQQHSIAERILGTLMAATRSTLYHSQLPQVY